MPVTADGGGLFLFFDMINYKLIQESFAGLIGFRKSYDSTDEHIDLSLQESTSHVFVNDLHDLFTIKNFSAAMSSPSNLVTLNNHNHNTIYNTGDISRHDGLVYLCLADNVVGDNLNDTTKWQPTTLLSQFLKNKYNYAVTQVVQKFLSFKKDLSQSKELLQKVALFDSFGGDVVTPLGAFVGYQINVKSALLANIIKKIGIQLLNADTLTIYLFHSSSTTAIATKEIVYTNAGKFQWFSLDDFILKKAGETFEDGYFTVGYFENDLSVGNKSLNAKMNIGNNFDCSTCNYKNVLLIEMWSKYFDIRPVRINSTLLDGINQSWEFEDAEVSETMNYGLNLLFSVECDFTDLIISNKELFVPFLSYQLTMTFLNAIANTQRHSGQATESANLANYWLKEGYYSQKLKKAIEQASFDLSNLDKNCLPCDQVKKGIVIESVW